MSLSELYLESDNTSIVKLLKEKKLIADDMFCNGTTKKPHPELKMKFRPINTNDGFNWRCNYCGTRKSIRTGTFFEYSRQSLTILFKLIIHWVLQTKYNAIGNIFDCSRQAVADFYHRLRFVAVEDYCKNTIKLGGPGVIVEIDESLFAKVQLVFLISKKSFYFLIINNLGQAS